MDWIGDTRCRDCKFFMTEGGDLTPAAIEAGLGCCSRRKRYGGMSDGKYILRRMVTVLPDDRSCGLFREKENSK